MDRPDVLVVGGGLSGLAAAARLARGGAQVLVLEANARVGGALAGCPVGRYRVELGPLWIDDRARLEAGLREIGVDPASRLELVPVDPVLRYEFGDGRTLVLPKDLSAAAEAVDELFPGEGKGYRSFIEAVGALDEADGAECPSLDAVAREHLRREDLREVVYSFARLQVLEPQAVPAFELPLARAHLAGAWVPRRGFASLIELLAEEARKAGVQFVMGARVSDLLVEAERVAGVQLAAGLRLRGRAVVATAPPAAVYGEWMPAEIKCPEAQRVLGMRLVAPPFLVQRGIEAPPPGLPYLTVLGRGARAPDQDGSTVMVVHPTAVDPTVVPPGRGLIRIAASLDFPAAGGSWGLRRKALAKAVVHRVVSVLGGAVDAGEEVHRYHDPELVSALLRLSSRGLYPAVTRWQLGEGRVLQDPGTPGGLFLAGAWTASGPGLGATLEGGIRAADRALASLEASKAAAGGT